MKLVLTFVQRRTLRWLLLLQAMVEAARLWINAEGLRMSAAMTFYGLLSLSPLVLLIVGLLGWGLDRNMVESTLLEQVESVMGARGASVVQAALASAQAPSQGLLASIIAFVLLISGATGVFAELQNALDKLWKVGRPPQENPQKVWWKIALQRLHGLGYVLIIGLLLISTMVLSTAVQLFAKFSATWLHMEPPGLLIGIINQCASFLIIVVLFTGLMRLGVGAKPTLRYLIRGAVLGAILFTLSKQALTWYLSTAAVVSAYGAAGSLVVVLMWMYVTAAVFLLGASFAKALDLQASLELPAP